MKIKPNDQTGFWEIHDDSGFVSKTESESTAQLFAAAPELLSALKIAADALEGYSGGDASDLPVIYAAIARAYGNSPQLENDWDGANEDYHA